MQEPVIRPAKHNDIETICSLGMGVEEFKTSNATVTFWPKNILTASIESSEVIFLAAEEMGKVVGFIIVNCNKALSKALVENIYVKPARRGRGVGTKLLQTTIQQIATEGYEYISVLTPPNDIAAIALYEKVGFIKGETFLWLDFSESEKFRR